MNNQSITRQLNAVGILIFISLAFQVGTWVIDRLDMKRAVAVQNTVTSQVETTDIMNATQSDQKKNAVEDQIKITTPQDGDVFCLEQVEPIVIQWVGPSDIASQYVSVGRDMKFQGGGLYVTELPGNRSATTSISEYSFDWDGTSLASISQMTGNTLQVGVSGYMKDGTPFTKIMEGSFERQSCE